MRQDLYRACKTRCEESSSTEILVTLPVMRKSQKIEFSTYSFLLGILGNMFTWEESFNLCRLCTSWTPSARVYAFYVPSR